MGWFLVLWRMKKSEGFEVEYFEAPNWDAAVREVKRKWWYRNAVDVHLAQIYGNRFRFLK